MPHDPHRRVIAIGDIHGCVHALDAVLDAIEPHRADEIIVLGDFIDCGRESAAVIERLLALRHECRLIVVMGNHEELMLASLDNERARTMWLNVGGVNTVFSYRYGGTIDDIPAAHIEFVQGCIPYHETERHVFTHASYDPDLPMDAQPPHLLRWAMLDPYDVRPHCSGKTFVVGHWAQQDGEILDLGFVKCIDTDCCGYGWLTALDVDSGRVWQASRWGALRKDETSAELQRAAELLQSATDSDENNRKGI